MAQQEPQPEAPDLGEAVQLETSETLTGDPNADALDSGYVPPDRPLAVDDEGTTAEEQRRGDSLDRRLEREEPDTGSRYARRTGERRYAPDALEDERAGRLVAPDEGAHSDSESTAIARDVGVDGGASSAEEAAIHEAEEDEQ